MATRVITVKVEDVAHGLAVTLDPRTPKGEHFTGNVDGFGFRFMLANRATAERERDRAMRAAAAWQAIIDSGMAG